MGHSEYDRIRNKNKDWCGARLLFDFYKSKNYSNGDILALAEEKSVTAPTNRVLHELIKMARQSEKND